MNYCLTKWGGHALFLFPIGKAPSDRQTGIASLIFQPGTGRQSGVRCVTSRQSPMKYLYDLVPAFSRTVRKGVFETAHTP